MGDREEMPSSGIIRPGPGMLAGPEQEAPLDP
jgi:hypothetical protein